jgi:hypothetical protein
MRAFAPLFILLIAFFVPHILYAQALGAEPLTVTIFPQYPQPYDTITITPQSSLFDLNASAVTISVNGKEIAKGSGSLSTAYTLGPAGETDTVLVTAASPGGTYKKTAVIRPASVALILEPQSTTHPFYEGAALVASEGRIRLIAVPEFRSAKGPLAASGLVYTWKAGDRVLTQQSGIGRSVLTSTAPSHFRDVTVSVTVSTPDNSIVGGTSMVISPVDPQLVIYRNSPLVGPNFDAALGTTFTMSGNEETFRAVSYFFKSNPTLSWSVNGAVSGSDPVITVRTTGDSTGTAALSASASQPGSYESAQDSLSVKFGQTQGGTNIFGL